MPRSIHAKVIENLKKDGAALIEYTILLGIIVVTVIAAITAVGVWVNTQWGALKTGIGA